MGSHTPLADLRIAVDTGGTFTDVVVSTAEGKLLSTKALTRFDDPWGSIAEALGFLSVELGTTAPELLQSISTFSYATTRATNAILTGTTAKTALITTEGFPDILTLRQGGRHDPFDFHSAFPAAYIPRSLTFEVPGRISAQGFERRPASREAVAAAVRELLAQGVEAVAVCLLWSHLEPAHELLVAEVLDELAPGLPFTLSHRLNPIIREYPRASSTAIDASLKPLMQSHFAMLGDELDRAGFRGDFLAVTASGGCLPVRDLIERPILSIDSGPSVAPVAARAYATEVDARNTLVYDTGGTSFDVSLVTDGQIAVTRDRWLGEEFTGHLLGVSSVAIHSIGSGGGSIAWIDPGGLLRVGPRSAGSLPGPACYGRGGTEPTVTDAAAASGYLDPAFFNAGRLALDVDAAREVIARHVAEPLGLSVPDAARAILAIATDAMVQAIRQITVNQGADPREFALLAGGGAGGLNVVAIARELGCATALVPRAAGTLSAVGALFSDLRAEFSRSRVTTSDAFDNAGVQATLARLDTEVDAFVGSLGETQVALSAERRQYFTEARYPDQVWDLRVPVLVEKATVAPAAVSAAAAAFHDLHLRTFAVNDDTSPVEFQQWTAAVEVDLPRPGLDIAFVGDDRAGEPRTLPAWFDGEQVDTAFVFGSTLSPDDVVAGPAVIVEPTTTIVLPPGSCATVLPSGSYLIAVTT